MTLRRTAAVALLAAQALALAHLVLVEHGAGADASVVENACERPHRESGVAHGHSVHADECRVAALSRTPSLFAVEAAADAAPAVHEPAGAERDASPPLELLNVAPKGSPPA